METKPKLRDGFLEDFILLLTAKLAGRKLSVPVISNEVLQSCLNCENFDEKTETCGVYRQRPPARVIAYGCVSYSDSDDIPF